MDSSDCGSVRCDNCDGATALLYCRADAARLCFACDRLVHAANALFARHSRTRLCDSCGCSPASIFCADEASVVCHDCDWEAHRSSSAHRRRPLEGFTACPSVSEFLAIFGFEDLDKKALLGDAEGFGYDDCDDFFVWDVIPCDDGFDGLFGSDSGRSFQATGVPPLPKNRNAVCGRYKDEVLRQLRDLAKTEPELSNECLCEDEPNSEALVPRRNVGPQRNDIGLQCEAEEQFEGSSCHWFSDMVHRDILQPRIQAEEIHRDSEKNSDTGDCLGYANNHHIEQSQNPMDSKASPGFQKVAAYEISSRERETAISRYKEKRKTRRFDKHIRYESRKVRAESRTRIKGRFAKIEL